MKHRKGSGPRGNPELARERRMASYNQQFWDILFSAQQSKGHERVFDTHAEAAAFMARYYRFRIDAIECRAQGATYLRDMYATGKDADGEVYSSRDRLARGPITITWKYQGNYVADSREEGHEQLAGGQVPLPVPQPIKEDKAERQMEQWLKKEEPVAESTHVCAEWNEYDACVVCHRPKDVK